MTAAAAGGRPFVHPAIDIVDPELYQRGPHAVYRHLRRDAPLAWDPLNQLWIVSRHADLVHVSLHPELFCSSRGVRPYLSVDLSLIGLDEPRHTEQRRLINKGFTPRMVRNLEPRIRQVTSEVLDAVASRGEADFVSDIAVPIPLIVIAELMGLPVEDRENLWRWSDAMIGGDGISDPTDPRLVAAANAFGEYVGYVSAIVEQRRERHRAATARGEPFEAEDLIGALVGASEEGVLNADEDLNKDELLMFLALVVVAGNETTRNAMSGAVVAFDAFPDQWQLLLDHPEHFATAPDEIVRYVSPVVTFVRTATQDTELRGQTILEGERVLLLYQSANRDEEVFDAPDELRVDRTPNDHVGFGIGPHYCLGANLAKLELRVLFEELARRLPDLRVAPGEGPTYGRSTLVHPIEHLPVVFTPEGR